jgi:hypothetical protein
MSLFVCTMRHALRLAACAWTILQGCAQAQPFFVVDHLPGAQQGDAPRAEIPVLRRAPLAQPLRLRVVVIPGSGCAGMAPIADRYFAGLLHAEVLVLHKPGTDVNAWPAPADCGDAFIAQDRLSAWRDHARAALRAALERDPPGTVRYWLVGISEGAELIPALAQDIPNLAGAVMISSSGLDPVEAGALQAKRLGYTADWERIARATTSAQPDATRLQGRTLGYWRDLWHWPLAQPLMDGAWPLLQAWGYADALIPAEAYVQFAARFGSRPGGFCSLHIPGADHGLQRAGYDGVQQVWTWMEQRERGPAIGCRHTNER